MPCTSKLILFAKSKRGRGCNHKLLAETVHMYMYVSSTRSPRWIPYSQWPSREESSWSQSEQNSTMTGWSSTDMI